MKTIMLVVISFSIVSCISGPPRLTQEQMERLRIIEVYKADESPSKEYTELSAVSAANCSGGPKATRQWGSSDKAIQILKMKAAAQMADAVIKVSCGSVPLLNNCWAARKCNGIAVRWTK